MESVTTSDTLFLFDKIAEALEVVTIIGFDTIDAN